MAALANAVIKLLSSMNCGEFIDRLRDFYILKKDSALWSK